MADAVVTGATLDGNTVTVDESIPADTAIETFSLQSLKNEVDQLTTTISKSQARLDFIQAIFGFLGITYP